MPPVRIQSGITMVGSLSAGWGVLAVSWLGLVGLLQGVHVLLLVGHPLGHKVDRIWTVCCLVWRAWGGAVVVVLVAVSFSAAFAPTGLVLLLLVACLLVGGPYWGRWLWTVLLDVSRVLAAVAPGRFRTRVRV